MGYSPPSSNAASHRANSATLKPQHAARLCVAPLLVILLWRTTFARFDSEPYDYAGLVETHLETLLHGLKA